MVAGDDPESNAVGDAVDGGGGRRLGGAQLLPVHRSRRVDDEQLGPAAPVPDRERQLVPVPDATTVRTCVHHLSTLGQKYVLEALDLEVGHETTLLIVRQRT